MSITVIDSIMGSGKTTWAINNFVNKHLEGRYLIVTPYISEIKRIMEMTAVKFLTPINLGSGKIGNVAELLSKGKNIVCTHELFRRFGEDCKNALSKYKYTLILDEALEVVEPVEFDKKDDIKFLLESRSIEIYPETDMVKWIGSDMTTRFDDVKSLAENKSLYRVDDNFFLQHYPSDIFSLFEDVYILTFMFDGTLMSPYFDLYGIEYETKSIITTENDEYYLSGYYPPDKSAFRDRIEIYYGKLNENIPQKKNVLSTTWSLNSNNSEYIRKIKNNMYNYCRHIVDAPSNRIMWTSIEKNRSKLKGNGYSKGFVPCNARASNDYQECTCLMYAVNWFVNPEIIKFFDKYEIKIDQEKVALANMLQWIWRSNIRVKDSSEIIKIYIPSTRMRGFLEGWLDS